MTQVRDEGQKPSVNLWVLILHPISMLKRFGVPPSKLITFSFMFYIG